MIPSNQANSGFRRTPVSKFLLGSAIGSSVLVNFPLKHYQGHFLYTHTDIFDKCQIWKVFTSRLVYLDLKDLFICSILLYYFRTFEKRFGSRKFCSYLLGTGVLATCLELLAVFGCRKWSLPLGPLPTGLLCFIYPLFIPYYCDIPRVPLSHLFGIPMTGKSMTYLLGLQAASSSSESLLVCACGLIAGMLWRVNFLKLNGVIQIPKFLSRIFNSSIGRVFGNSQAVEENKSLLGATLEIQRQEALERLEEQQLRQWTRQMMPNGHIGRPQPQNLVNGPGLFGAGNNNAEGLRQRLNVDVEEEEDPVVEEASEELTQQLLEMGFPEQAVRNALIMSNNDVSMATNFLLQHT